VAEGILESHYVGLGYVVAVDAAGGLPVILPAVAGHEGRDAREALEFVDGIVLAGGTDIAPQTYHQAPVGGTTQKPDPSRDVFELELVREARARDVPILGICRGIQLLNIAYGGTLDQHRPHRTESLASVPGLKAQVTDINVEQGTKIRSTFEQERFQVVCLHHQAIDKVGAGLRVTARASDGLIEGLEDPMAHFVMGVLWHPEQMLDRDGSLAVYRALVEAAIAR
jgi:putative glutamine amidotransferase